MLVWPLPLLLKYASSVLPGWAVGFQLFPSDQFGFPSKPVQVTVAACRVVKDEIRPTDAIAAAIFREREYIALLRYG
jgi:hypothetical protein